MKMYGADVVASPSDRTEYGRKVLAETPDTPGSLGIAISEGVEDAVTHENTRYCLGSVLNHVLMHQTVIGQEAVLQMEMAEADPDIIVACAGGGSNFAGLTFPFVGKKLRGEADYRIIAAEPSAAPSLTRGVYAYDYGDTGKMAPIVKMHTLGHDFVPDPIHAGGLRYHGMSPQVSLLKDQGIIEAQAVPQSKTFDAARLFTRNELALPAPEPAHAIAVVKDEVEQAKEAGQTPTILFHMCGHGHFDAAAYTRYLEGELEDFELPEERIEHALETVPSV
jgi:tryptophan synthase beta chain